MKMLAWAAALPLACLMQVPAMADPAVIPQVLNAAGQHVPGQGAMCINPDGSSCAPGAAAVSSALAGSAGSSTTIGPFTPQLGRAIWITLSGTWSGTVTVCRSIDSGATCLPLTIAGQSWASYGANAQEPIGDETVAGATYYLQMTLSAGAVSYRLAQ